jgi:hypothetical protein
MTMALMEPLLMFLLNVVQRSIIHSLLCSPDHGGFMYINADLYHKGTHGTAAVLT